MIQLCVSIVHPHNKWRLIKNQMLIYKQWRSAAGLYHRGYNMNRAGNLCNPHISINDWLFGIFWQKEFCFAFFSFFTQVFALSLSDSIQILPWYKTTQYNIFIIGNSISTESQKYFYPAWFIQNDLNNTSKSVLCMPSWITSDQTLFYSMVI